MRGAWAGAQEPGSDFRRYRRHRRILDRNQCNLADRHPGTKATRWPEHRETNLGFDRPPLSRGINASLIRAESVPVSRIDFCHGKIDEHIRRSELTIDYCAFANLSTRAQVAFDQGWKVAA